MLKTTEDKAALVLLLIGIGIYIGYGFSVAGDGGVAIVLGKLFVRAVVGVLLGVAAALITAKVTDTAFGTLSSACLRLAGMIVFAGAVAEPFDWLFLEPLILVGLYIALAMWLFKLEPLPAIVFTLVLIVMHFATLSALWAVGMDDYGASDPVDVGDPDELDEAVGVDDVTTDADAADERGVDELLEPEPGLDEPDTLDVAPDLDEPPD